MSRSNGNGLADVEMLTTMIGDVYECALQPRLWSRVLEQLCQLLSAKAASIHVIDPVNGRAAIHAEHGTDPVWTERLLSRYAAMSPIGAAVLLADVGEPVGAFDFIDEAEFVESRFYKEWCAPQGYHDMMGALIAKRPNEVGAISATRLVVQPRFGKRESDLLRLIAPHVRRAVTISGMIEHRTVAHGALKTVIDNLATAVLIVDADGRIVQSNTAAQAMLAEASMISQTVGRLTICDGAADHALRAALATGVPEPRMLPISEVGAAPRVAVLLQVDKPSGLVALFVHTPEPDTPALTRQLVQVFGFSPREVGVLIPLVEGRSASDIAELLGVSLSTVRTHIQRLLDKSGTTRQSDLVRLVLQSMPPVRLS